MIHALPASYDTWKNTPPGDDDEEHEVEINATAVIDGMMTVRLPRGYQEDDLLPHVKDELKVHLAEAQREVLHQYGIEIELDDVEVG